MSNVIPFPTYESIPERNLEKMWENIKGRDCDKLSRNLLKSIAKNSDTVQTQDIPLPAKEMWDSSTSSYVPFDPWGAAYIINEKKEELLMRIFMALPNQNEEGEVLRGWQKYNCSSLMETLKKKDIRPNKQVALSLQNWREMVRQDHKALRDECRYSELPGYDDRIGY